MQYDHTKYSVEKGVLAFYNNLTSQVDHMVDPPDTYLFRRKYLRGLSQTIVKTEFEACGISTKHSSIEEILDGVKHIEGAKKAVSLYMRQNHREMENSVP